MKARIEAARGWLQGRSPRERVMLGLMVAVIAALLGWYGVVSPGLSWRAAAAERRSEAQARLVRIEAAAERLAPSGEGARDAGEIQALAERMAAAAGIAASFSPAQTGGVDFTVPAAPTALLFAWIGQLQVQHGIEPVALTVTENADATLSAQGTLTSPG